MRSRIGFPYLAYPTCRNRWRQRFCHVSRRIDVHGSLLVASAPYLGNDCLGRSKIPRAQEHDLAVSVAAKRVHFAIGRDLINACMCAGIRSKHKARVNSDGHNRSW